MMISSGHFVHLMRDNLLFEIHFALFVHGLADSFVFEVQKKKKKKKTTEMKGR